MATALLDLSEAIPINKLKVPYNGVKTDAKGPTKFLNSTFIY